MANLCVICGAKIGLFENHYFDKERDGNVCASCYLTEKNKPQPETDEQKRFRELKRLAKGVIVTTTHQLDGYSVAQYLGVESVEYVIGTGLLSELTSGIADILGARSRAFESKLQRAKLEAMQAIKMIAASRGANAILGLDMDYTEFSDNRVALILNGTLTKVVPKQ